MNNKKTYSNADAVDVLHKVSNFYINTKVPHDYGTGEVYTSVEVHTLKEIADNPDTTLTELSKNTGKTKGAISQILKKIEKKGLIYKEIDKNNENRFFLRITEKGKILNDCHKEYDEKHFGESMNIVREMFSEEQINTTFEVLEAWLNIRRKVQERRIKEKK
ncbi:MarR family winged helix-turn-helix transcriptional regulator [Miniphocaeibacter halophilus]|uniref:Winged helix-turn-helix transcriptional regulator n=1 Tax=Miniphocaeibacter halophilus TaxID=2931922 RepID=A0AC61MQA1_9FIRM|nr:MarR family winged helix-turn-helix transcriptional regulator [Miniphocaeibacter halophilus]QQK07780.1 winged helix-turn-helix transcriptional regulator [Miniphocaeibacter halophilus]